MSHKHWNMGGRPAHRTLLVLTLIIAAVIGACSRVPDTGITRLKPTDAGSLQSYLLRHQVAVEQFRLRGPFPVTTQENVSIALSQREYISGDLYLSAVPDKAPLVILLHGYGNTKADHGYQGVHLATWGLHTLTIQLPNSGPWLRHGRTLARIVEYIRRNPEALDQHIDVNRIVLAGHSFGASSAAIAMAVGAPVSGGVLLDPAAVGSDLAVQMRKIAKPVMVVGADPKVFATRGRNYFFDYIPTVAEVSIRGASHEDAQFPMAGMGTDPHGTEEHQISFVSALTAAAFSLASSGSLDYAWSSYRDALKSGKFIDAKKK